MRQPAIRDDLSVLHQLWCWGAWEPGEPLPAAANPFEALAADVEEVRPTWEVIGAEVVPWWAKERPGRRPPAWWALEAPEPRRRVGGIGHTRHEALKVWRPEYHKGIPTGWLSQWEVDYFSGRARNVRTGEPIGQEYAGRSFPFDAYDPTDPPRYESEAAYLQRLGLLLPGERPTEQPDEIPDYDGFHPPNTGAAA